uniref:Fe2OG dioxygenase domain-containing protein n=1 Tax=Oryza rufipogon TaxID=4529 RepID=A0A0E0QQ87_ORYRU
MEGINDDSNRDIITEAAAMAFADPHLQIPDRYIRAVGGGGVVVVGDGESLELPVVDMARLLDPEHREAEVALLGSACRSWGFFQITRFNSSSNSSSYPLPLEDKNTVAVRPGGIEGFGHHFRSSAGKLDWAENLMVETQPFQQRNLEFWPSKPPTFRDSIDKYAMEMWNLTTRLLRFMASDLGVEQETLLAAFRGKRQTFGLHRYPPCRHPEKVIGISPHSDGFGLTLLLQVNDTLGLQVSKDGRWHPVLTNGRYKSVFHRVAVDAERGRVTVVVFQDACINGLVKPLPELGETPRYRAIGKSEYFKGHTAEVLGQGERFIDTLKKDEWCADPLSSAEESDAMAAIELGDCKDRSTFGHPSQIAPGQTRLTLEFFGDRLPEKKLQLVDMGVKAMNRDIITQDAAMAFADHHLHIPDRFVRADEVPAAGEVVVVGGDDESSELPVVDMARLLDPEHREEEIAWLGSACRSWGSSRTRTRWLSVLAALKDSAITSDHQLAKDHQLANLDWAENLILLIYQGSFRDSIDKYTVEMSNLTMRLLRFMASDLGVEQEPLLAAFRGKRQSTALHHYPPCRHPEKVIGIAPHSDGFGLTLLLQVDDTPGLQVSNGGRWHPVRPLPGAFIINIGETLEVLTNGLYRSVFHRVVVDTERDRVTVVVFQDVCIDGVLKPLPELGEPLYHAIGKLEYFKGHTTEVVGQGERFIDTLKKGVSGSAANPLIGQNKRVRGLF